MRKISVVLVTYNRLTLLKKCIGALSQSTYPIAHIIIVDNNSTDGTGEFLDKVADERVVVKHLCKNIGGAGGFYTGIKLFQECTSDDFAWVMDDDTIPNKEALANFVKASEDVGRFGFLAGNIRWIDKSPAMMNVPKVRNSGWNKTVPKEKDTLYPVLDSASFVSLLVSRYAIEKVGYPIKEFFIWGDDVEFTERVSSYCPSYFVAQSIAVHETSKNIGTNIMVETGSKVNRYFYDIRNKIYRGRMKPFKDHAKMDLSIVMLLCKLIISPNVKQRFKKIQVVLKGIFWGMLFHPQIEMVSSRISNEKHS